MVYYVNTFGDGAMWAKVSTENRFRGLASEISNTELRATVSGVQACWGTVTTVLNSSY